MSIIKNLTAQGLYIPNNIVPVEIDISSTLTTTSTTFAMGGTNSTPPSYIDRLELKMYKQSIRIIQLENKLDSEECENLKKMLESNDEASVILAKEIIDNLETA
jgi:hypothetical protein